MEIEFIRAGMHTSVQDLGRHGHRGAGVPLSGAVDAFAMRVANLLVGNPDHTAGLEITLSGPELRFSEDVLVAMGGAEFGGLKSWQPMQMAAGEVLKIGKARQGCRGYLAIAGGLKFPPVLGSQSTYLRGKFGGWQGRTLRDGDVLEGHGSPRRVTGRWHIDRRILPRYSPSPTVCVISGAQHDEYGDDLYTSAFKVSPQSDRMGVRLSGIELKRRESYELTSATVVPGTIQVPPDGQPIVLMADAQTVGGYPQVGHVARVDLPLMAQLRPGDSVRFTPVSLYEAHELLITREQTLGMLHEGLADKFV